MKKLLLVVMLIVMSSAGVASAIQPLGNLGIFGDAARVDQDGNHLCHIIEPEGVPSFITMTIYILHNTQGAKSIQFASPIPACFAQSSDLSSNIPWGNVIGSLTGGVTIGYGGCESGIVTVATWSYDIGGATSPNCCEWTLVGDPTSASGTIEGTDCSDVLVTGVPGTSGYIVPFGGNPNQCMCEDVPVETRTWGAVKELYKEL